MYLLVYSLRLTYIDSYTLLFWSIKTSNYCYSLRVFKASSSVVGSGFLGESRSASILVPFLEGAEILGKTKIHLLIEFEGDFCPDIRILSLRYLCSSFSLTMPSYFFSVLWMFWYMSLKSTVDSFVTMRAISREPERSPFNYLSGLT